MRKFILSADAGCDLTPELLKKYDVKVLPLKFMVGKDEYSSDDGKITTEEICRRMIAGEKTSTSQANPVDAEIYLKELLSLGRDIVHLTMSSAMSGTYETMKNVAEKLNSESRNKIFVVDSLCQCSGYGLLLAMTADESDAKNLTAEQAAKYAESVRLKVVHNFSVDTLTFLARGGRVPSYLATIGNLIKLKPVLHVDDSGKIVMLKKQLGRRRALDDLAARFIDTYDGYYPHAFICHACCEEDAEYVKTKINERIPEVEITILPLGTIIVSHSGPGTLALFFTAASRE